MSDLDFLFMLYIPVSIREKSKINKNPLIVFKFTFNLFLINLQYIPTSLKDNGKLSHCIRHIIIVKRCAAIDDMIKTHCNNAIHTIPD